MANGLRVIGPHVQDFNPFGRKGRTGCGEQPLHGSRVASDHGEVPLRGQIDQRWVFTSRHFAKISYGIERLGGMNQMLQHIVLDIVRNDPCESTATKQNGPLRFHPGYGALMYGLQSSSLDVGTEKA